MTTANDVLFNLNIEINWKSENVDTFLLYAVFSGPQTLKKFNTKKFFGLIYVVLWVVSSNLYYGHW